MSNHTDKLSTTPNKPLESSLKTPVLLVFLGIFVALNIRVGLAAQLPPCASCHSEQDLLKTSPLDKEAAKGLGPGALKHSAHAKLTCMDCHRDLVGKPEGAMPHSKPGPAACARCHEQVALHYQASIHAQALVKGAKDAPACADCHGAHLILPVSNPASSVNPRNQTSTCGICHANPKLVKRYEIPIPSPLPAYEQSVHGRALTEKGLTVTAVCSDCHESHDLRPFSDPKSLIFKANIPKTCGKCHFGIYQTYEQSVHGKALATGVPDAPSCTDCHGEHSINPAEEKTSKIYGAQISKTTCPWCHSSVRIVNRYGIVTERVTSYLDSYHGVASRAGSNEVANCASCHGYHNILPSSDSLSTVNKANLPKTCGRCHPNAGANFAKGPVHLVATPTKEALGSLGGVVIYWFRRIYLWLIIVVIGGMVLHNTLVMGRRLIEHYRRKTRESTPRFTAAETVQHALLTLAFILLVISGFALRFPDSWWAAAIVKSEVGFKTRSVVHRIGATILVLTSLWNVLYILFTRQGRMEIRALFPGLADVRDFLQNMAYVLGLSSQRPKYDRYDYTQKAEYWALVWGTVIMALSGFPMWFPDLFMRFFPKWVLDVLRVVHYYEAWLATLAILVWHFYYMIFDPEAYPMNWTWITGRIPVDGLIHEHPKEFERLYGVKVGGTKTPDKPAGEKGS